MSIPRLSVIIPAYNAALFLKEAVDSVLRQGHENLEIVVVDDGSTDETSVIVAGFGDAIRYIRQSNAGPSQARNNGFAASTGEVIGFLDADDVWPDDHVAALLPHLTSGSHDLARGLVETVCDLGTDSEKRTPPEYLYPLVGACLYSRRIIEKVGGFDEAMRQGEDCDWHVRLGECGAREKRVDHVTLFYRRHSGNVTNDREAVMRGVLAASRKKLARLRAGVHL